MALAANRLSGPAPMAAAPEGARGLSADEIGARLSAGLVNETVGGHGRTLGQIMRANVVTPFNAILGALLVVVFIVGPPQDGLFGVVLVTNTAIGVVQELRARRALDRVAILTAPTSRVIRDGSIAELPANRIVLDDVVELGPGDQVPVDGTVLTSAGLEVDESLLTGESESVPKALGSALLAGSFVVAGSGRFRATRVGDASYAGTLEARAKRFSRVRSELLESTNGILRLVALAMVPVGCGLVLGQIFRSGQTLADALRGSVAGLVGFVPEGLVLLTSIAFTLGAWRLARLGALVQELAAVEGLARVDTLCIDKTGTLTKPGMRLEAVEVLPGGGGLCVRDILAAVAGADPSPNATMRALSAAGGPPPTWPVVSRVPFSSTRKWSAVEFDGQGTFLLGAPEVIAPVLDGDVAAQIDGHQRAGQRVLLLAAMQGSIIGGELSAGELPGRVLPLALLVLAEELRPDAKATVAYLASEGVEIKVLSGDAPETVARVAADVGIPFAGAPVDASRLADDALASALATNTVFGRVRPEQKLSAVRALQSGGHVVAMVGDGVNDVPALKDADLGIAMGSGSPASRSVARVVLLDSAFSAIPAILTEGRRVIANVERVAKLFVTKSVYSAALAVLVTIFGLPFLVFPRHLSVVSALTIGIPGFFLAFAAPAPRALPGFLGRVLRFTIPAGVAAATASFAAYAVCRATPGSTQIQASSAAMLALVVVGICVLILAAWPLDRWRLLMTVAVTAGIVLPFASSFARRFFSVQLPAASVLLATGAVTAGSIVALTVFLLVRRTFAVNLASEEASPR